MPLRRLLPLLLALGAGALLPAPAFAEGAGTLPGAQAVGAFADLGAAHGCAIEAGNAVRCWGHGYAGRLGSGALDDRLDGAGSPDEAAVAPVGPDVQAVATGDAHSCVIDTGTVRCWGQGALGQLGSGLRDNRGDGFPDALSGTDAPSSVPLGEPATAISAGSGFTCAITASGAVRCWGQGSSGQLGTGGTDHRLDGLPGPGGDGASVVPLGGAAVAISAGDAHACAILAGGGVRCWGSGNQGRLGSGASDDRLDGIVDAATGTDAASTVPLPAPAAAIAAGLAHTCALLTDGRVACWGDAAAGQVGAGRTDDRLDGVVSGSGAAATDAAALVPLLPEGTTAAAAPRTPSLPALAIAAGDDHSCAVTSDGAVRCWGAGTAGALGSGATTARLNSSATNPANEASRVTLGAPAIAVSAAGTSSCALLSDGALRCWGRGSQGRLGGRAGDDRLDGVADPATGTDDATTVAIGALPRHPGDRAPLPVPAAPATPATPPFAAAAPPRAAEPALPATVKLTGKRRGVRIDAVVARRGAATCPKALTATLRDDRRKRLARAKLTVRARAGACRVRGTVRLRRALPRKRAVVVSLSGRAIVARELPAVPR